MAVKMTSLNAVFVKLIRLKMLQISKSRPEQRAVFIQKTPQSRFVSDVLPADAKINSND